jgi:hypothetical protein
MSALGHWRPGPAGRRFHHVRYCPESDVRPPKCDRSRMGWTGRAPAPNGSQSARGLCQEKEHGHASHVHGSRSDHHRNRYG